MARKQSLERRKHPTELADNEKYRRLVEDIEAKRISVRELLEELDGKFSDALIESVREELGSDAFAQS